MKRTITILLSTALSLPIVGVQSAEYPLADGGGPRFASARDYNVQTGAETGKAIGGGVDEYAAAPMASETGPAPAGALDYEPLGTASQPAVFESYWDVTGVRSPTEWAGRLAYGLERHVATARVEWLLWFSRGRNTPVLAQIFNPSGSVDDYGDEPIGTNARNGGRFSLGRLLPDGVTRAEGRFWGLEDGAERFFAQSNGVPVILRPFDNVAPGGADFLLIASPGVLTNGSIDILSKNDLIGADAWLRRTWWDDGRYRLDLLAGYQFTRMDDSLRIQSLSTTVIPIGSTPAGTVLDVQDLFRTQNEFHGGSVGFVAEFRKKALSLELFGKVAFGDMREAIIISGRTIDREPGSPPITGNGGLFALPTNQGAYERNRFAVVPELNINGVLNISPTWRLMGGYTLIYWSNAVLAGNQIDTRVNTTQIFGPLVGPSRPLFTFNRSDFLVQGLSLGAEYRW